MSWLITQSGEALNEQHIQKIYADKSKVKAQLAGFPVTVAVDLEPEQALQIARDIVEQIALGHSVEVVDAAVRRIADLR